MTITSPANITEQTHNAIQAWLAETIGEHAAFDFADRFEIGEPPTPIVMEAATRLRGWCMLAPEADFLPSDIFDDIETITAAVLDD